MGYQSASPARETSTCTVVVRRDTGLSEPDAEVVGRVEVGDSGFSTDCGEGRVIEILQREGCAVGAEIIDIVQEWQPDSASTCYRARARFLRLRRPPNPGDLVDDPEYAQHNVEQQSHTQRSRQNSVIWAAVITGVVIGVTVGVATALKDDR